MIKSKFITLVIPLVVVCALVLVACTPAPTATPAPATTTAAPSATPVTPIVLKGDTVHTETHISGKSTIERLKVIEERSKGRLKFDITTGGALTKAADAMTTVGRGALDWAYGYGGFVTGQDPRFELGGMPFAFKNGEDCVNAMRSTPLGGLFEAAANKFNVTWVGWVAAASFYTISKVPIKTVEDFQGKKIRASATAWQEALKLLKAAPTNIITAEVYPAFEKGVIDGAWYPLYTLETYKLIEQIKYINTTPIINGNLYGMWFNLDTWKKLPKDLQDLIRDVYHEMEPNSFQEEVKDWEKYSAMAKAAGIQFITPSAEEQQRWKTLGGLPSWEWIAGRMTPEDGATFLKAMKDWHGIK